MNLGLVQKSSKPLMSAIMASTLEAIASAAQADDPMSHPISCSTAEGDIRVLEAEKEHAQQQQVLGISALTPAGAVVGIITGKEDDKLEMLSGDYIKEIEARIAATKEQCNL